MTQLETLEAAALQLTPAERGHLAERLLASLESDDGILAEWVAEAETRLDVFERGVTTALNHVDVLTSLQTKLV